MDENLKDERLERLMPWIAPALVGGALCAGIAVLSFAAASPGTMEDGWAELTAVKHFAQDGVVSWNLGGAHADGFWSFLDLFLKAMVVRATGGDPIRISFWFSLFMQITVPLLGLGAVLWLARARERREATLLALICGALLASSQAMANGSIRMLETPLVIVTAFALLGTWLFAERFTTRIVWAIIIEAILVSLARPEGVLLGIAVLVLMYLDRERPVAPELRPITALFPLAIGAYYLWHWRYFGAFAPTVYYAHTSSDRIEQISAGWEYVSHYLQSFAGFGALLPVIAAPFAALAPGWDNVTARSRFLVIEIVAVAWLVVVIWLGGDSHSGGRLLAPSIALAAFGLIFAILHTTGQLRRGLLIGAVTLASLQSLHVLGSFDAAQMAMADWPERADSGRNACTQAFAYALETGAPGGTLAEADFPSLRYFGDGLHVVDLTGTNDREIAHHAVAGLVRHGKFSYADVLSLRPEVWLWGTKIAAEPAQGRRHAITEISIDALLGDRRAQSILLGRVHALDKSAADGIAELYVPVSLELCHTYYNMLVRKDATDGFSKLAAKGFNVGRGHEAGTATSIPGSTEPEAKGEGSEE